MHSKEELRQKRKEAYQKGKAKRDADPLYQALKEKVKQDRKDKYRAFQDQQKQAKLPHCENYHLRENYYY
jgi:hypothetical protein